MALGLPNQNILHGSVKSSLHSNFGRPSSMSSEATSDREPRCQPECPERHPLSGNFFYPLLIGLFRIFLSQKERRKGSLFFFHHRFFNQAHSSDSLYNHPSCGWAISIRTRKTDRIECTKYSEYLAQFIRNGRAHLLKRPSSSSSFVPPYPVLALVHLASSIAFSECRKVARTRLWQTKVTLTQRGKKVRFLTLFAICSHTNDLEPDPLFTGEADEWFTLIFPDYDNFCEKGKSITKARRWRDRRWPMFVEDLEEWMQTVPGKKKKSYWHEVSQAH